MSRQFEIHEVRAEFVLVLFVNRRPVTTLTGPIKEDLMIIGSAWSNAQFQLANRHHARLSGNQHHHPYVKWDGVERRKTPHHA